MIMLQSLTLMAVALLLAVACLRDIATRTIPDLVSCGLIAIGVGIRLVDGNALAALIASTIVFALAAFCWRFGWLGGGDVKLLTACAWLVQPMQVPQLVLVTALVGGALACLYLALARWPAGSSHHFAPERSRSFVTRLWRVECWRIRHQASLPYGCAISAATLFALLER